MARLHPPAPCAESLTLSFDVMGLQWPFGLSCSVCVSISTRVQMCEAKGHVLLSD